MAQVTIRLTLSQAELLKEIVEAEVAECKRVATDRDYAVVLAGGVDTRAYQRDAVVRGTAADGILKELA